MFQANLTLGIFSIGILAESHGCTLKSHLSIINGTQMTQIKQICTENNNKKIRENQKNLRYPCSILKFVEHPKSLKTLVII